MLPGQMAQPNEQNTPRATQKGAAGVTTNGLNWLAQGRGQEGRRQGENPQGRNSG